MNNLNSLIIEGSVYVIESVNPSVFTIQVAKANTKCTDITDFAYFKVVNPLVTKPVRNNQVRIVGRLNTDYVNDVFIEAEHIEIR